MRQDRTNQTLSKITNFHQEGHIFWIETQEAQVQVQVFSETIIQVKAIPKPLKTESFSYAVAGKPLFTKFQTEEDEEVYTITTAKIKLKVQKEPLRFQFYTTDDVLLSEDDPAFGISWIGTEITNYKKLQKEERFIGLGEKTGNLEKGGMSYTNWNTDQFGYGAESDPMYMSIPFYMGLVNQKVYGIFLDNTYLTRFNFGASTNRFSYFQAADGEMNYYFIHEDTVAKVIENYTYLTGRIQMPPLWSLGFQQCRYSYYPDTEVLNVAQTFRQKDIPADVIYLDIHYMERYKVFTWDEERFSDPGTLVKRLRELGFHVVLILDPGVKKEKDYLHYEEGIEKDYFVKYPDGELYEGQVWPGWCHFPDFTKPEVREWWGDSYKMLTDLDIDGFWNDMNEPAVWGKHFPDMVEFDYDGQGATHKKAHNVYGMQMARATFEGTKKLLNGKRPFVLTRAGFAGIQRYATVWTGDNVSGEEQMLLDARLINSMGLGGIAFAGYDVGGFVGEASVNLFNRWIAQGAFSPFFRCHTMINSKDAEPWAFGEESEEIARNYIKLRYRLLPYIYSLFYEARQTGMPVNRSLALEYTWDDKVYEYTYQNEYLFGASILVCPVNSYNPIHKLYLPEGKWYDLFNDTLYEGKREIFMETPKDKLPVFVKSGGILAMQSSVNHTNEKPESTLEVHIYEGDQGSSFTYYEDDGETYAFEKGEFYRRNITYDAVNRCLRISKAEGNYTSKFDQIKVYLHIFEKKALKIQIDGVSLPSEIENYRFVQAISNFDPWEYAEDFSKVIQDLPSITANLPQEELIINF